VVHVPARQAHEHHALHQSVAADGALGVVVAERPTVLGEDASPRELAEDPVGERLRRRIVAPGWRELLSVVDTMRAPTVCSACLAVMDELLEVSERRRSVPALLGFNVSQVGNQREAIRVDERVASLCCAATSLLRL
jgi:hypothetical protein